MKVTVEISDANELETVLSFFARLHLHNITISDETGESDLNRTTDNAPDPTKLFGIWKYRPRTIEEIRTMAWNNRKHI